MSDKSEQTHALSYQSPRAIQDQTANRGSGTQAQLGFAFAGGCLPASVLWMLIARRLGEPITLLGPINIPSRVLLLALVLTVTGGLFFLLGTWAWRKSLRMKRAMLFALVAGAAYPILVEARIGELVFFDLLHLNLKYWEQFVVPRLWVDVTIAIVYPWLASGIMVALCRP